MELTTVSRGCRTAGKSGTNWAEGIVRTKGIICGTTREFLKEHDQMKIYRVKRVGGLLKRR